MENYQKKQKQKQANFGPKWVWLYGQNWAKLGPVLRKKQRK